jgi:hypothetical protein
MKDNCNNIPKNGYDYCKNHKPKPKKCQFKGCGNTTKIHLKYCGLHSPIRSKQPTSGIRKLGSETYEVENSIKHSHSVTDEFQSYPNSNNMPDQSCKNAECKNPTSTGMSICWPCFEEMKAATGLYQSEHSITKSEDITPKISAPGTFVCGICGKENIEGRVAKGVQKTVGNTIMGFFGTLTFLTGGLTAPLMLGAGMMGAAISGSAEKYSLCLECRAK